MYIFYLVFSGTLKRVNVKSLFRLELLDAMLTVPLMTRLPLRMPPGLALKFFFCPKFLPEVCRMAC